MNRAILLLIPGILLLTSRGFTATDEHHIRALLFPVGDSRVVGMVNLEQLPHGGTNISVVARGLTPGNEYLSLYYENHTCALEPYSEDDVIGRYVANRGGIGTTQSKVEDDLDEINSVSVRRASDFCSCRLRRCSPGSLNRLTFLVDSQHQARAVGDI